MRFLDALYGDERLVPSGSNFNKYERYRRLRRWLLARQHAGTAITAIKLFHTVIFFVFMIIILHFTYSGVRNRISKWTGLSTTAILIEAVILAMNGGRCPLTGVVEDLGSEHGSVSDIFLPNWVARHIPHISTALLGLGLLGLAVQRLRT